MFKEQFAVNVKIKRNANLPDVDPLKVKCVGLEREYNIF